MFNFIRGHHTKKASKFGNKLAPGKKLKTKKKAEKKEECRRCGKRECTVIQDYEYTADYFIRTWFCGNCENLLRLTYLPKRIYHFKNGKRVGVRP